MPGQHVRERVLLHDLKEPVLISAFTSFNTGGATAGSALGYALNQWDARLVAEFDAEECYHTARIRPTIRTVEGRAVVEQPQNLVYRVDAPERSFLILLGVEPSFHWRDFIETVASFALRAGVQTAINLKAVPATVPHTRETPLRAIFSDASLQQELGLTTLENQDGPADFGRLLNLQLAAMGCRTADVYALEPYYAATLPHAPAAVRLLQAIEQAYGLSLDYEPLLDLAQRQLATIEAAVSSSEQLQQALAALESRHQDPALLGEGNALQASDEQPPVELDASDVLREAESILRGSQ